MTKKAWGENDLLTTQEASLVLNVGVRTLERWRAQGTGPAFRQMTDRVVRYRYRELQQWADRGLTLSASPPPQGARR